MTVTHQAVAAVIGLEIGVLGQERGDFGLDGLGEQAARAVAKNFGERIAKPKFWTGMADSPCISTR
jgi:hypothetical protein